MTGPSRDAIADALALVTSVREGDHEGTAVIVGNANLTLVSMFLARLASDLVNVLCTFDGADEGAALAGLRAHFLGQQS